MSRNFNGFSYIDFSPGAFTNLDGGPTTIAVLWRPASIHAGNLIWARDASGAKVWGINPYSDGLPYFTAGGFTTGHPYVPGVWQLMAFTKDDGFSTVRSHLYRYDTHVWQHQSMGERADSTLLPVTGIRIGAAPNAGEALRGDIAVAGVWSTVLSAESLEALAPSLTRWQSANPLALWAFNQANPADPVPDLTGGSANSTAITGTSISPDEPVGFTYGTSSSKQARVGSAWVPVTRKIRVGGTWVSST